MYVIGITGGVGSGKSLVAKKLEELYNVELLTADELGHIVTMRGYLGYKKVKERFGEDILDKDGFIDRKKLADIIFNDDDARKDINDIIHPEVISYIQNYISERREKKGCIILETAIMYETGCDKLCDEVWYVYVPKDIRIERLRKNRGYSYKKSCAIIEKQKSDMYFIEKADFVIENLGSIEELEQNLRILPERIINILL